MFMRYVKACSKLMKTASFFVTGFSSLEQFSEKVPLQVLILRLTSRLESKLPVRFIDLISFSSSRVPRAQFGAF